jgi:hypothetical protein
MLVTSEETVLIGQTKRLTMTQEASKNWHEEGMLASSPSMPHFILNLLAEMSDDSIITKGWI